MLRTAPEIVLTMEQEPIPLTRLARTNTAACVRLPLPSPLAAMALCAIIVLTAGAPAATAQTMAALTRPADEPLAGGVSSMSLTIGKSTLLRLPSPVTRISVGSSWVADIRLINPKEVYILGKSFGTTNVILWLNGESRVIDVTVVMDAAALQQKYQILMPEETNIKVTVAGDSLVLSGSVSDALKADRVVAIADAYVRPFLTNNRIGLMQAASMGPGGNAQNQWDPRLQIWAPVPGVPGGMMGGGMNMGTMMGGMQAGGGGGAAAEIPSAGQGLGGIHIINLLRVGSNHQVMLEVKIMEINRTLAEKLGFDFQQGVKRLGIASQQIVTGIIGGVPGNLFHLPSATVTAQGDFWFIDAQKTDDLVRILAEPNIMAVSGQEASFMVGGEILIPVPAGSGFGTTLQSKQFGVGLRFTPTVLEGDRINLVVSPEVTELVKFETVATNIIGGSASVVPTFTTRRMSTTVQMRDGQSFAIGGLLQDNYKSKIQSFPMLGEIPILGTLFRSTNYQKNKTELMVVVTPRLVKPLLAEYKVPTDGFIEPSRSELLLKGNMEGPPKQLPENEMPAKDAPANVAPAKEAPANVAPAKEAPGAGGYFDWMWNWLLPKKSPANEAPGAGVQPQAEPVANPADAGGFQMR